MLQSIDLETAQRTTWDVIIAGSSFSAMFFLKGLNPELRVLIVERGRIIDHQDQISTGGQPPEAFGLRNSSGHEKRWIARTLFGGNSNCWWGQVPRFHPSDFRLFENHGRAAPWHIGYDDLEEAYLDVERVMEVAGGGSDHLLPRSGAFPFPPHELSRTDAACIAAFPDIWVPVPTARSNGGSRVPCCTNGFCNLCPIDAKFTILNGIGQFERDNVFLLTATEVREVVIEAGTAKGVIVRHGDQTATLRGDAVALGANAIFNTTILLRSGLRSPALGTYLHEQESRVVILDIDAPNYFGGSSITSHCYAFYDGPHRSQEAAVLIENYNAPASVRPEEGKWTNRMYLKLIAEDIPNAQNRVTLSSDDTPLIHWAGHDAYATRGLDRAQSGLASILPFEIERIVYVATVPTEAHIQGTHRIGDDVETSVVDYGLKTHEVRNLLALGAGAFPSCSPANPTLTLSALALHAGRLL